MAILNIINIVVEMFINSHIIKNKSKSGPGVCLRKYNSQTKEIILATLIGLVFAIGISYALIGGFGIRKCGPSQYKDGANCLSCQKTLGELCISCDGPDLCAECPPIHFFDTQNKTCASCLSIHGSSCLECSNRRECSRCTPGKFIKDGQCTNCLPGCKRCSGKACDECDPNYTMVNGTCQLCNKTLKYCDTCSSDKACTKCSIPELVVLSNNNTCGCPFGNNSYFDDSSTKCVCKTDFYMRNKTCSQCDRVIPKCDSCSYASG